MSLRWTEEELAAYRGRSRPAAEATPPPAAPAKASKSSKYRNQPTEVDGFRFPSQLEAKRYLSLKFAQQRGEVSHFLRQVPFHLPGGVVYRLDFLVFWTDGRVSYEDAKGMETREFKTKRRLVESLYPVEIELVGKT